LDRPWKGHQPLLVFNFNFEYVKRLQSSEPLHAKMNPTSCLFTVCKETCLPIGWQTVYDEKIHQNAALFWFWLRDVGILCSRAVIQRTVDISPTFLEHGSAEKIAVWAHANRDPNKLNL
jgi:hypothetical protein